MLKFVLESTKAIGDSIIAIAVLSEAVSQGYTGCPIILDFCIRGQ